MSSIGIHLSLSTFKTAAEALASAAAADMQCTAVQIFVASPKDLKMPKPATDEQIKAFRGYVDAGNRLFAHGKYLYNFSRAPSDEAQRHARGVLVAEMQKARAMSCEGLVIHQGKAVEKMERAVARRNFVENLRLALTAFDAAAAAAAAAGADDNFQLLLENAAGQGTEIGYELKELEELVTLLNHRRIGVCIDTCHAYAAGQLSPTAVAAFFADAHRRFGDKLRLIHFNDSMVEFGAKKDRHADLGVGEMGSSMLRAVVVEAAALRLPLVLETPATSRPYAQQLTMIREYLREPQQSKKHKKI